MMKYSMRVESKTVDTVEGMQNWIELLATRYKAKIDDFNLVFEPWKLTDPNHCDIHIYGDLKSFLKLWKDYHKKTSVRRGW